MSGSDGKFGTFGGVFTPSLLTILGVIMYLRLPWVVGSAGLYQTLGIILVAHVISISTGLSISSIATDKAVGAGGPYYIISRSLGLPIGGALGLALFVGLAFSISLYIIGFSESLLTYFKLEATVENIRICGTIVLVALTVVTFVSTALAIKTQYLILTLIGLSLVSIFLGSGETGTAQPHLSAPPDASPLPAVFAIFFPAVTGFTAGVNMSGDLRSPKRSIPSGTMLAILVGLVVYIGLAVYLALVVPPERLLTDPELLINISWSGPVVVAGIWGATISSALGSILGAPRILQAVSGDAITPKVFARGYGPTQEPRNALALAFLIGEAGILIGELDAIARIVSMVFLTTYCVLNLSCALESWASPDFRPEFRIPKSISIVGALTCLVVMIQLDLPAMVGSMSLMGLLYLHLQRKQLRLESGDTWEGIWDTVVRTGLQRLASGPRQDRHWKPNVLAFSAEARSDSDPETAHRELLEALAGKNGIVTRVHVSGRAGLRARAPAPAPAEPSLNKPTTESETAGIFYRALPGAAEPEHAILQFCQHHGFAGIEPNTVLFRWAEYADQPEQLAGLLEDLAGLDFNELVWAQGGADASGPKRRIDVWWRDRGGNIPLSLSLARFVTSSRLWEQADIRFLLLSDNASNNDVLYARVRRFLKVMRVDADVKVISNTLNVKGYEEWVRDESADASLVLIPLPDRASEADTHFLTRAARVLPDLGQVLFLRASSKFEEILSPGKSATQSLLPGPAGSDDSFVLPALTLPSPAPLAEVVSELAMHYQDVLASFDEHCVARVHSQNLALVRRLKAALERQFGLLEKGLAGANARKRRQLINRFQSSFVIDATEVIDEHLREGLPDQQATLEGRLEAVLDEERLVGTERVTLRIERDLPDFQASEEDSPHLRRFKRRRRRGAWLLRRKPRYAVPWTALKRHYFDRTARELVSPMASQLIGESHQLAVHLAKVLSGARAGIAGTVIETFEGDLSDDALSDIKQKGLAPFEEVVERTKLLVLQHRSDMRERSHALLQQLCDDLERLDVARLTRKERRVPRGGDRVRAELRELPKRFEHTQRKLHERAKIALMVTAFHHRLTAIVQRQKEAVVLQLRNGPLRACQDVRKALTGLSHTLASEPAKNSTAPRARSSDEDRLDPKEAVAVLRTEVEPALADLPDTVVILTDAAIDRLEEGDHDAVETTELSLRSLAQFLVESELLAGVYEQLDSAPELELRAMTAARDVTRLLAFQLSELEDLGLADPGERSAHLAPAIESGSERLDAELSSLQHLVQAVDERFERQLESVIRASNPSRLSEAGLALGQHRRLRKGKIAVSGAQGVLRRAQAIARQGVVGLLYRGTAGMVLARSLERREGDRASLVERLRTLVRDNSPQQAVLDAMPYYYRQLFFGQALNESFWVGREQEIARARKAIQSHRSGADGIVLVVGDPGAGKTALCQRIVSRALDQRITHWLRPPPGGSVSVSDFHSALERALSRRGTADELLDGLPEHAAVVIDDLELWWQRTEDGFAVLDHVLSLIGRHGHRVLFMVSVSRQAFRFLTRLRPLADRSLCVIECAPMAARELGSVLTLRHGSTGMKFELGGRREDQLSAFQLARLFARHFNYGGGSVGVALQSWISHIERVRDGVMTVRTPAKPNDDLLDELRGTWRALLLELLLHRRLTLTRLERVVGMPPQRLQADVDTLVRAGLIVRGRHDLLEINPFVQPLINGHFEQRGLLPA